MQKRDKVKYELHCILWKREKNIRERREQAGISAVSCALEYLKIKKYARFPPNDNQKYRS